MRIQDFKLERFFAKYEFSAPYLLSSSDCESMTVGELLDIAGRPRGELDDVWLGYTETLGAPELRRQISGLYEVIGADRVMVCAGAEEGIFIFMNSALQAGDHVVVQFPGYQSLYEIARSIGCEVSPWTMNDGQQWSVEDLRRIVRPETKALVLNHPHNPTGHVPTRGMLEEILDLARSNGMYVFSDEVYRMLEHGGQGTLPAAADRYERAVSLGVMSKTFGLAGLRIGWLATRDEELFARMSSFKDFTSICNSAPSERLAIIALQNRERLIERNLDIIRRNLDLLDEFFARHEDKFEWNRPKAGSTAFPRIKLDMNVEDLCIDIVERKGVLLLPSTLYDFGDKHFRIGFGRRNLPEALSKLEEYVRERL